MFNKKFFPLLCLGFSMLFFMVACNPQGSGQSSAGPPPPTPTDLSSITPGTDQTDLQGPDGKRSPEQSTKDKDTDTTLAKTCPDTLQPTAADNPLSSGENSSSCVCKEEGPFASVHLLMFSGTGNSAADSWREMFGTDLGSAAKRSEKLIAPFVEKSGNKVRHIPLDGQIPKGQQSTFTFRGLIEVNSIRVEKEFQKLAEELQNETKRCKRSLVLIMINDHGADNCTTSLYHSTWLYLIRKYIPCCHHVEIVTGACEGSSLSDAKNIQDAIDEYGAWSTEPMVKQFHAENPDYPPDEKLPKELVDAMKEAAYQQIPKCNNTSLSYSSVTGEINSNPIIYGDGFFEAWSKGFADSANKNNGVISEQTLVDAQAAGAAAAKDQHPGRTDINWKRNIDKFFGK